MTPKISSTISKTVGYAIFVSSGISYLTNMATEPSSKAITVGVSALGIIGLLSGLCFTMTKCIEDKNMKNTLIYSGEKFLHSCLLIVQTIFLKFAYDGFSAFMKKEFIPLVANIASYVFYLLVISIGIYAIYFSIYGFEDLN
jgi:hypothetical protein